MATTTPLTGNQQTRSSIWKIAFKVDCASQWRIQDFPRGGAPTPKVGARTYFFGRKLHENLDPPMHHIRRAMAKARTDILREEHHYNFCKKDL